ncbi:hypothetical protein K9857_20575 [Pseudomonas sp. REP124]|uniref:hypothetical protein n=1 Tax=Pseudomonas sp. REP124 TaxID=2875731 RepID=UPI001CCE2148|nr:hypothetical protein [Pseudomonas sp. REP124]MBZ9783934.1 hypothetical protein [Pseudomonas sp. REP124]
MDLVDNHVKRSVATDIRCEDGLSWFEKWLDTDEGLISYWERGRKKATKYPALASKCLAGVLPILNGPAGCDRQLSQDGETLRYLAEWQGLRGENLDVKLDSKVVLVCSGSGVRVEFKHVPYRAGVAKELPLVDLYNPHYEIWATRQASEQERLEIFERTGVCTLEIKDKITKKISSALEAAIHIAEGGLGVGEFTNLLDGRLRKSSSFLLWRIVMPARTPPALTKYKSAYAKYSLCNTDFEIHAIGAVLASGQYLFHAGTWPGGDKDEFTTRRPLSATFCPQVALANAIHRYKAFESGKIDILVLRASAPKTNVFAYKINRGSHAHEKEVLFACGAKLNIISRRLISDGCKVYDSNSNFKEVPIFVLEVDIS